jgi:hypothetical protein
MTKFVLSKSDTLPGDRSVETFINDKYEIIIDVKQVGHIDETWQKTGTIKIKHKDGKEMIKNIYGECDVDKKNWLYSTFAIGGVSCSADNFVVAESFVLRINISDKTPAHRKSANRCAQAVFLRKKNPYENNILST